MAGDLASNRNEILTLLDSAWTDVPAEFPRFPAQGPLVFAMTDGDGVPASIKRQAWARVTLQHTASGSRAISQRRYTNAGILIVECFVFRNVSNDDDLVQRVASFIGKRIKAHRGSVLLTNVAVVERPINNGFAQCNVQTAFSWEEFNR